MIESLESRTLLSFAAPVSYNIGTQPDGFVPNAAPINVVSGDFNGDGKLDLIVSHKADNSIYFLAGNGDGTFKPAVPDSDWRGDRGPHVRPATSTMTGNSISSCPGPTARRSCCSATAMARSSREIDSSSFAVSGYYPRGWAVGDFNGDGKLDVASTLPSDTSDAGLFIVLPGRGDGTFGPGIVSPAGMLHYSRWAAAGRFQSRRQAGCCHRGWAGNERHDGHGPR